MIDIILIEPENSGNIGACARVMKNFGFTSLVLVAPKRKHLSDEAIARAKHAGDVLRKAKVSGFSCLDKYDTLVATTAKTGSDYNIPRSPLTPKELAKKVGPKGKTGIVIGREGIGLTNDEIKRCDLTVSIPASEGYPTLNISHALAIILYELSDAKGGDKKITPASKKDKEVLFSYIDKALDRIDFTTPDKKETQKIVWKRVLGKAMLTKREAFALMGFFKK